MVFAGFKFTGGSCCCCPGNIALLSDTTGSMSPAPLATVKSLYKDVVNNDDIIGMTCLCGVFDYQDITEGSPYNTTGLKTLLGLSSVPENRPAVITAIDSYVTGAGGDAKEQQLMSLKYMAENWPSLSVDPYRGDKAKIILWAGDAEGHTSADGPSYPSLAATITALTDNDVVVFALNFGAGGAGIDTGGQASAIVAATGGQLFNNVTTGDSAALQNAVKTFLEGL